MNNSDGVHSSRRSGEAMAVPTSRFASFPKRTSATHPREGDRSWARAAIVDSIVAAHGGPVEPRTPSGEDAAFRPVFPATP